MEQFAKPKRIGISVNEEQHDKIRRICKRWNINQFECIGVMIDSIQEDHYGFATAKQSVRGMGEKKNAILKKLKTLDMQSLERLLSNAGITDFNFDE